MDNKFALFAAVAILFGVSLDVFLFEGIVTLATGRKLMQLIGWLALWR